MTSQTIPATLYVHGNVLEMRVLLTLLSRGEPRATTSTPRIYCNAVPPPPSGRLRARLFARRSFVSPPIHSVQTCFFTQLDLRLLKLPSCRRKRNKLRMKLPKMFLEIHIDLNNIYEKHYNFKTKFVRRSFQIVLVIFRYRNI